MDTSNMVFAIAFKNGKIEQMAMQQDGGEAFKRYHSNHGINVKMWKVPGCEHYHEIDDITKQEIQNFRSHFGRWD